MKSVQPKPLDISRHLRTRRLEQEVENRTAYTIDTAELNIYETQHIAEQVELTFTSPVLASMIRGKKVMHLPGTPSFDFLPGESVIVPGQETMRIDFPEAQTQNPTQCLALAIAPVKQEQFGAFADLPMRPAAPNSAAMNSLFTALESGVDPIDAILELEGIE